MFWRLRFAEHRLLLLKFNMSESFRCSFSSDDIRDVEVRARAAIEQMVARSWRQCGDDNNATLSQLFSSFSTHSSV